MTGVSRQLTGVGVSRGTATGPVLRMASRPQLPAPRQVTDPAAETRALTDAFALVVADLMVRSGNASGPAADVLAAQVEMAADPSLMDAAVAAVMLGSDAAHAVHAAFSSFRSMFEAAGGFLAERVTDLDDIRDRVVASLLSRAMPGVPKPGHPFVLVAADLAPADTATLDPADVLALVTERGGPTSHTAILARTLGIPAVVACADAATIADGVFVTVDGEAGTVDVGVQPVDFGPADGGAPTRAEAPSGHVRGETSDGHRVKLLLNVGDATNPRVRGDGVGLFRTEFLFLGRHTAPSADEQRRAYADVFRAHQGQTLVVRTLDAGADKPLPFLTLADEPNPALGVRGYRTARRSPEVLDGQLAAIALAVKDTDASIWTMAPMITTVAEAAAFASQARGHGLPMVGVMIEVPAAALRIRQILEVVDFASIGTNDLSQYVMAADREGGDLADLLDPWQPAVLSLLAMCGAAGRAAGKPVGVCGEAASDPLLAPVLVGFGITSLSMSSPALPGVATALAEISLADCERAAEAALDMSDPASARAAVRTVVG